MKLHNVAKYFDTDPFYDGYTGAFLFKGQVASFDDHASDGSTSRRRVLSLAPGLALPGRQVVTLYGARWVVGSGNPDGFGGTEIRQSFGMKKATDLYAVLTPSQACLAAAGTPAYAQALFLKDTVNALEDSEYDSQFNVFFSPGEAVAEGTFLRDSASRLYRVRQQYMAVEGLRIAETDRLDADAAQALVFTTSTYNAATDSYTTTSASTTGVQIDLPKFYRWRQAAEGLPLRGDRMVFVPTAVTPTVGREFTMQGATWRVIQVQAEIDVWAVQARRK